MIMLIPQFNNFNMAAYARGRSSGYHVDCVEKRRIEMEDQNFKLSIPEKMDLGKNSDDVATEIKAILHHMKNND